MLTLKERQEVFKWFRHFCTINRFPMQVDIEGWKVRAGTTTKLRSWACKAWYSLFIAHSLYVILTLLWTLLFVHGVPLHHIIIHGVLASTAADLVLWYYIMYVKYADEDAALIRMMLTGTINGELSEPTESRAASGKRGFKDLQEYTMQDLIAIGLPYMVLLTLPVCWASFIYDPTMRVLLYSALPECYKNRLSFWICFVEEMRFLLMFTGIAVPVWQMQVISFDLVNRSLDLLTDTALKAYTVGTLRMGVAYKNLRCLQLYVILLNTVHQNIIFTWKLESIGMSIVSGYAAIAHFQDYPIFGIMYCVIFMDNVVIYMLIYEKGFEVPDKFHRAKNSLRLHVSKYGNAAQWKHSNRQLVSIPSVGIKVGNYNILERTSTPVFLHYVLTNIVNMIVAYR